MHKAEAGAAVGARGIHASFVDEAAKLGGLKGTLIVVAVQNDQAEPAALVWLMANPAHAVETIPPGEGVPGRERRRKYLALWHVAEMAGQRQVARQAVRECAIKIGREEDAGEHFFELSHFVGGKGNVICH